MRQKVLEEKVRQADYLIQLGLQDLEKENTRFWVLRFLFCMQNGNSVSLAQPQVLFSI